MKICASSPPAWAAVTVYVPAGKNRPQELQRHRDDLVLVAVFLEVEVADGAARDQAEHVADPRHLMPGELAQPLVRQLAQLRTPAADPGLVVDDELSVAGAPDVQLDVLRVGGDGGLERAAGHRGAGTASAAMCGDPDVVTVHTHDGMPAGQPSGIREVMAVAAPEKEPAQK